MSIDFYLKDIERLESEGAIVLLKWDGQRSKNKNTVFISRMETGFQFRKDTDDLEATTQEAIDDYDAFHKQSN